MSIMFSAIAVAAAWLSWFVALDLRAGGLRSHEEQQS